MLMRTHHFELFRVLYGKKCGQLYEHPFIGNRGIFYSLCRIHVFQAWMLSRQAL